MHPLYGNRRLPTVDLLDARMYFFYLTHKESMVNKAFIAMNPTNQQLIYLHFTTHNLEKKG